VKLIITLIKFITWLMPEQNYNIDTITKMEDELSMKAKTLVKNIFYGQGK
jgi:hypothetical protein